MSKRRIRRLIALVAAVGAGIAFAIPSGSASAVTCNPGYFINDHAPDCLSGCSGTCGCAICPDCGPRIC